MKVNLHCRSSNSIRSKEIKEGDVIAGSNLTLDSESKHFSHMNVIAAECKVLA